jgi:hypothetical protein
MSLPKNGAAVPFILSDSILGAASLCVPHQSKIVGYLVALTGIEPVYPP